MEGDMGWRVAGGAYCLHVRTSGHPIALHAYPHLAKPHHCSPPRRCARPFTCCRKASLLALQPKDELSGVLTGVINLP